MSEKKRRKTGFPIFLAVLILLHAALILALQSQRFADWYCGEAVPRIANAVGGVMSLIPTAVCEICIAALVCCGVILVILLILLIFLRKREGYRRFVAGCCRLAMVFAVIGIGGELIYDAAMMRSTPVGQQQTHDFEELTALWNLTMTQINTLSTAVDRDENYHFIHRSDSEIRTAIDASRLKLAAEYPRFQYAKPPVPKTSVFSAVVSKFGDDAYFIEPWFETVFTIRAQNRGTYPSIFAHEYSHYCGYYREDEANFFAHLLSTQSDDLNVQYAGWMDIINRVWNAIELDFFGHKPTDAERDNPEYQAYCDSLVDYDLWLYVGDRTGNYERFHAERGEENVVDEYKKEPELPKAAADLIQKQGQKHFENLQAHLGAHYYDGVVQLLLDYYADQLEPYRTENLSIEKE